MSPGFTPTAWATMERPSTAGWPHQGALDEIDALSASNRCVPDAHRERKLVELRYRAVHQVGRRSTDSCDRTGPDRFPGGLLPEILEQHIPGSRDRTGDGTRPPTGRNRRKC